MSTRLSFRPRPLDLNKPLTIVRDINELDAADGLVSRDITHQHEALDKDNEEVWLALSPTLSNPLSAPAGLTSGQRVLWIIELPVPEDCWYL